MKKDTAHLQARLSGAKNCHEMVISAPHWGTSMVYPRPTQLPCEKHHAMGGIGPASGIGLRGPKGLRGASSTGSLRAK